MSKKSKEQKAAQAKEEVPRPNHTHGAEVGAVAGEVAGGLIGAMAGPPGAVAGMVIGAAMGALAGKALDFDAERAHDHDAELDDEIGVTSGDLGAPNLLHPPARVGAFSAASSGAGAPSRQPAEGPIPQDGDED